MRHVSQPYVPSAWRVDQQVANAAETVPGRRHAPHDHVEHFLLLEQVPDLQAGKHRGRGAPDVPWLDTIALGRRQIDFDFQSRLLRRSIDARPDNPVNSHDGRFDVLGRATEQLIGIAIDPDHDRVARSGHHRSPAFAQVGLHAGMESRIAVSHVPDGRHRPVIVGRTGDAHPQLCGIDVDHLIPEDGAPHVSADVAHARD